MDVIIKWPFIFELAFALKYANKFVCV